MVGGGEPIPLLEVPAVAEVVKRIYDRPFWERSEPLEVAADLFQQARSEFADVLERRGWPLPYAEIGRENFMIRGVTVLMGDE